MKKIKKFRINLREREVLRLLKSTTQVTDVTRQLEDAVRQEMRLLQPAVSPAAEYETQPREKIPEELAAAAPAQWIAASLYLVSIGPDVENELREAQQRGETMRAHMLHCVAMEALEQANNFVYRLLNDEARDEGCELVRQRIAVSPGTWEKIGGILPGDKIGVAFVNDDSFQPRYSSAAIAYWLPVKKKSARGA